MRLWYWKDEGWIEEASGIREKSAKQIPSGSPKYSRVNIETMPDDGIGVAVSFLTSKQRLNFGEEENRMVWQRNDSEAPSAWKINSQEIKYDARSIKKCLRI